MLRWELGSEYWPSALRLSTSHTQLVPSANVELVRSIFADLVSRDPPRLDRYDADVVLDLSASVGPDRGVYRGHDGLRGYLSYYRESWDDLDFNVEEYIDAGEDRVILVLVTSGKGRDSGVPVVATAAYLLTLRDSNVVSLQLYQTREEALEAVGGGL